jgi:hypothetical protein
VGRKTRLHCLCSRTYQTQERAGAIRWGGRHANTAFTRALTRYKNAQGLGGEEDSDVTAEEKRLKEIEESKFLGGDVEHTHLVKGLDYALLQKVCATALFC